MPHAIHTGFLIYPDVTQLDATGPAQILSRVPGAVIHMTWKTLDPVASDAGFSILPADTLETCPDLDVVCVPGGLGQLPLMGDQEVLEFPKRQGKQARYVTSVCSGSLLWGAAGLMKGDKAACHWAFREMLPAFGAEPVRNELSRTAIEYPVEGSRAALILVLRLPRNSRTRTRLKLFSSLWNTIRTRPLMWERRKRPALSWRPKYAPSLRALEQQLKRAARCG